MYFRLDSSFNNHPQSRLVETDDEQALEVVWGRKSAYHGEFNADNFLEEISVEDLLKLDFLKTHSGLLVLSRRIVNHINNLNLQTMDFYDCVLNAHSKKIKGEFLTIKNNRKLNIVNKDVTPNHFWPYLKKFKYENYVITKKQDFLFGWDIAIPTMLICSEQFRNIVPNSMFSIDYKELPCCFDEAKRRR
ncbi:MULTISPECIES: hypothetical protein [unclassified Pseudovibrio]|uniref:hypothetical protein n=1 Tax=unclassified Pseudovibrio TaxID=2627060 RepID=UPI0007AE4EB0|nr:MULTISPECIES: hypothetical protein [unclassified Pseudovibrio]KZK95261.1 hypothetical protein PsW74_04045 [Pseudovibrio sp. W74]KZL10778.1 hypothetical protein PsAD14_01250 [Pseudovibrio sp. Ad14]